MKTSSIPANLWTRLILICLFASSCFVIYAYQKMASSHRAAMDSVEQWNQCRELADQIKGLQDKPLKVAERLQTAVQLARTLEESAQAANIQLDQLIRIDPRPVRQIENTPYQEQATYFELRKVTLRQLILLLHKISNEHQGTTVVDLRLESTRTGGMNAEYATNSTQEETWDAEVTLTSLVFNP